MKSTDDNNPFDVLYRGGACLFSEAGAKVAVHTDGPLPCFAQEHR